MKSSKILLFPITLMISHMITSTTACGGLFCEPNTPVVQAGEAIAFGVNGNEIEMHVQIVYEGPADQFSWVLPVPKTPDDISVGSDVMFSALFQETLPTFVLDIAQNASTTCTDDDFGPMMCPMSMAEDMSVARDAAIVLQDGVVGPYDFVVLEAAEGNPDSVLEWLNENGYDQPEGSADLMNYYALLDQKFVALKLTKNSQTGDIQPLILKYTMDDATENMPIACVPIKLTAIAANDNMPVQVYVMAASRAVPLNYLDVTLDDNQVDWVNCLNNPGCYDDNYRARVRSALAPLNNHGFVTEYAGTNEVMQDKVALTELNLEELKAQTVPLDYLTMMADAGVPAIPVVESIIETYIPNMSEDSEFFCPSLYIPESWFNMGSCLNNYQPPSANWVFDPVAMTDELDTKVVQPALEAQQFVDRYSYLTRMYGVLGPETMDKDPFFTLRDDAPDVSNVHRATGVPQCVVDQGPIALDITAEGSDITVTIPASPICGTWTQTDDVDIVVTDNISPAVTLTSWGYSDQIARVLTRLPEGGFEQEELDATVAEADTWVVDQTVISYVKSDQSEVSSASAAVSMRAMTGFFSATFIAVVALLL